MKWICLESNNVLLTLCGLFYGVLCIFSIVTGIMYAQGKRKLNPLELSDKFVKKLSKENKLNKFAITMGWVTIVVGIFQGITSLGILYGYNSFLSYFALAFTIFSICSVLFKLIKKVNLFSLLKLIAYVIILLILIISGLRKYRALDDALNYLKSNDIVNITKINEGYYFDGPGKETAIIFYPGASVQYTSYAKLMYKLAYNGYDCFLLSMPLDFALIGVNKASNIISKYNYNKWCMSGHSLGGVAASMYASNNPEEISCIINLASYPNKKIPSNIKYISFYGSNDKVLNEKSLKEAKKYLPNDSFDFVIDGGNHSNFGNYGFQKGDGISSITNDDQQDYVVNKIVEILK